MFDIFHSMMDAMKLNDYDDDSFLDEDDVDDYEDEFIDDIDEVEEREKEKRGSLFEKLAKRKNTRKSRKESADYESESDDRDDSYDDSYADIENYASGGTRARSGSVSADYSADRTQSKTFKAREEQPAREPKTSSKVTPMRSSAKRRDTYMGPAGVNFQRPKTMEDAEMVAEELMHGNVVVLNLEGLDMEVAQRIVDFTAGCCFALDGTCTEVTSYVFAFTPSDIPVSGDQMDTRGGSIPYVNAGY
ncbi:MAG: cell division protein SepF [Blautia sp.]|nr:cell division protein SepF [Blautia sp.]